MPLVTMYGPETNQFLHKYKPKHEFSNNVVCATGKGSDQPAHTRSLIRAFASRLNNFMTVNLLTEHHLEFLSLKRGCTGWSESTLVKMPHCWKSHVLAQIMYATDCDKFNNLTFKAPPIICSRRQFQILQLFQK